MEKQEYIMLVPGLIYGVAIIDLLKIFRDRKIYYEIIGWGLYLLLAICWIWLETYEKLDLLTLTTAGYFLYLTQSLLYARVAFVITPEEKDHLDTKKYFKDNYRLFFLLLASMAVLMIFLRINVFDDGRILAIRFILIPVLLACAFIDKAWLRNVTLLFLFANKIYIILVANKVSQYIN